MSQNDLILLLLFPWYFDEDSMFYNIHLIYLVLCSVYVISDKISRPYVYIVGSKRYDSTIQRGNI